jgi:hypothetical protein
VTLKTLMLDKLGELSGCVAGPGTGKNYHYARHKLQCLWWFREPHEIRIRILRQAVRTRDPQLAPVAFRGVAYILQLSKELKGSGRRIS